MLIKLTSFFFKISNPVNIIEYMFEKMKILRAYRLLPQQKRIPVRNYLACSASHGLVRTLIHASEDYDWIITDYRTLPVNHK